ncbi:unnamed protein product, partial [Mesorhabditis belari]|uniref:Uncharacterized protein n=1 Tax=Mesorhabditis belari TaxID=2138241 RepID=A0AAF3FI04_9BILA
MATRAHQIPFDQNAKKYQCFCGNLHIKKGARIVSCLLALSLAVTVIFSLTRTATVAFQNLFSAAFGVVVFGMLLYGVFKEKRLYVLPYMIFQTISLVLTFISLIALLIMVATNSNAISQLAQDYGSLEQLGMSQDDFNKALSGFVVFMIIFICISGLVEAYFLEVIYRFYTFLKDRETSFNFNFDTCTPGFTNTQVHPPQYDGMMG